MTFCNQQLLQRVAINFFATSNEQVLQPVTSDFLQWATSNEFQRLTSNEWKIAPQGKINNPFYFHKKKENVIMIKIHHIAIYGKDIKSVYGSDFFSSYFTYFCDLLSEQSKFFVSKYLLRQLCEAFDFVFLSNIAHMYDANLGTHILIF